MVKSFDYVSLTVFCTTSTNMFNKKLQNWMITFVSMNYFQKSQPILIKYLYEKALALKCTCHSN